MTRKHLRPPTPAARKRRRKDLSPPDIPDPSDEVVSHILEDGAIENAHHALVKSWLVSVRNDYRTDLDRLGYYAGDGQIAAGLTAIKKRAALLVKALRESDAIRVGILNDLE
jgi:hypothetical protein